MLATMPLSELLAFERSFTRPVSGWACSQKYRKLALSISSRRPSSTGVRADPDPAMGAPATDPREAPAAAIPWSSFRRVRRGTAFSILKSANGNKNAQCGDLGRGSGSTGRCGRNTDNTYAACQCGVGRSGPETRFGPAKTTAHPQRQGKGNPGRTERRG